MDNYGRILCHIYVVYDTLVNVTVYGIASAANLSLRISLSQAFDPHSPGLSWFISQSDLCFQELLFVCNDLPILKCLFVFGSEV